MNEADFLSWLTDRSDAIRTPVYIYSEQVLDRDLVKLKALFSADVRVFYSLKANPQPAIVRHLFRQGVGSEIASAGERRVCSAAGVAANHVLVGGVAKTSDYMASVCNQECAGIVLDSMTEWRRLCEIVSTNKRARVLLRINPGASLGGLDMAGDSQFGLATEQALTIAKECQRNPHVDFMGLHFYFGSQRLSPDPVVTMVRIAGDVLDELGRAGLRVNVVDLGLGCGVPYLEKDVDLNMELLAEKLQLIWQSPPWSSVRLWTEAGRALVGRSGFYISRVLDKKERHGKVFIYLDGGLHTHNPGVGVGRFFRSNPRFLFVRQNSRRVSTAMESVDIVGNLCTSADALGRAVIAPVLDIGDLVVIPNSGAYCHTTGLWGFNSQPLFCEAMLTSEGKLNYVQPQYEICLGASEGTCSNEN